MDKTLSEIDLGGKETQPNSIQAATPNIGKPRGRPLYLEGELYTKMRPIFLFWCAHWFLKSLILLPNTISPMNWLSMPTKNAIQVRSYGQCYNGQERWKAHLAELRINELLKLLNVKHWMGRFFRFNWFKLGIQNDPCQVLNFLTDFVYLIIQNTGAMRAKHLN